MRCNVGRRRHEAWVREVQETWVREVHEAWARGARGMGKRGMGKRGAKWGAGAKKKTRAKSGIQGAWEQGGPHCSEEDEEQCVPSK